MGFFGFGKKNKEKEQEKMKTGLEKTRTGFWGNILNTLTGSVIDDDMYDDLEEQLILADVGGEVAVRLVDKLRDRVHEKGLKTGEEATIRCSSPPTAAWESTISAPTPRVAATPS